MRAPALEKGLEILERLVEEGRPLTLSRLAESLGRNVSEIQRMVRVLLERGYLDRNEQGGYLPGFRLFRLGRYRQPHRFLQDVAEPHLREFADATGHSVHLAVEEAGRMLNLVEARGSGLVAVTVRMGTMLPLEESVSGRVLLASTGRGMSADRSGIAEKGYLARESPLYRGVNDLGVPVRDRRGGRCAALTCSWLRGKGAAVPDSDEATVGARLLAAAISIESRLEAPSRPKV